jgi:hypothetical protein
MVAEKWRWWTAVLLLIIVTGAAGCGTSSNDAEGTTSETTAQDAQRDKLAAEKEPAMTSGQKQALARAQTLILNAGPSKKGLIELLQLPDYGGYSATEATFAANKAEVNWNQQALETAADYVGMKAFSKDALIRRLTRVEQFTPSQARYAVNKLY